MLNVSIYQFPALREFVQMGKPVWGTCAGLIFLADKATGRLFLSKVLICGQQSQLQPQHRGFWVFRVCIL